MYHIARYDSATGNYLGLCRDGYGRPLQYPLALARQIAARFRTTRYAGYIYKPRRAR